MDAAKKKQYSVKQDEEDRKNFDSKWDKLNSKLSAQNPSYQAPQVPFRKDALIRDYNDLYAKIYDKEKFVNL